MYVSAADCIKLYYLVRFFGLDAEEPQEEEESKWQDRISSGFDRLVAFASTELDKRRRSTEGSDSCNTSPDSGIGHCHADLPPTSMIPSKQTLKLIPNPKPTLLPPGKSWVIEPSPLLDQGSDDVGPPRTPSPSSPMAANNNLTINFSPEPAPPPPEKSPTRLHPSLLKYQRYQEDKKKPDAHFKKKFYYREHWKDDSWTKNEDRPDKFRPKGKDWDWNKDHHSDPHIVGGDDWRSGSHDFNWKN